MMNFGSDDTVIMGNARLYEIMKEKEEIYAKEDFTDEENANCRICYHERLGG